MHQAQIHFIAKRQASCQRKWWSNYPTPDDGLIRYWRQGSLKPAPPLQLETTKFMIKQLNLCTRLRNIDSLISPSWAADRKYSILTIIAYWSEICGSDHCRKKHQKRLSAPSHWLLDKLSGAYAPRPSPGPHKLRDCMPLIVFIRNR